MGLFRLILAFSVVAFHVGIARQPFDHEVAVKSFFAVSGFYMALVLDGKYPPTREGVRGFYANRLLRLYPTYGLVLVFALAAALLTQHTKGGLYEGFFARYAWIGGAGLLAVLGQLLILGQDALLFVGVSPSGYFPTRAFYLLPEREQAYRLALLPPAWSLSIELMFYAVAPYLMRLRSRWLMAIVLGTFLLRFATRHLVPWRNDPWSYRLFPFEIGTFLIGALAYRLYRRIEVPAWSSAIGRAATVATLVGLMALARLPLAVFWSPLAMLAALPLLFAATKEDGLDRALGELSYPLYLVHWPVAALVQALGVRGYPWVTIVVSILLSMALVKWVDVPVDRLRQRLARRIEAALP